MREKEHPPGPGVDRADRKFPLENPNWNNNDPNDRGKMGDVRNLIIKEIRKSVP
jgi:hypothetical protein